MTPIDPHRDEAMKCEICGLGPEEGVTVFRQNPLGEVGVWRCREDNEVAVDPGVRDLVEVIKSEPPQR